MLNVRSVEKFVRERFPGDDVRLQYFEVSCSAGSLLSGVLSWLGWLFPSFKKVPGFSIPSPVPPSL